MKIKCDGTDENKQRIKKKFLQNMHVYTRELLSNHKDFPVRKMRLNISRSVCKIFFSR